MWQRCAEEDLLARLREPGRGAGGLPGADEGELRVCDKDARDERAEECVDPEETACSEAMNALDCDAFFALF